MYGYESTIDNDWHDDHCFSGFVRRDLEYDVKVGDLVKCPTIGENATGVIVEKSKVTGLFVVIATHNNATCCFQSQHLEVISEGR